MKCFEVNFHYHFYQDTPDAAKIKLLRMLTTPIYGSFFIKLRNYKVFQSLQQFLRKINNSALILSSKNHGFRWFGTPVSQFRNLISSKRQQKIVCSFEKIVLNK